MDPWIVPHVTLAFFALIMALVSFWVKRSPWIWGSFLILAYTLAFFGKLVTPIALVPIVTLFALHVLMKSEIRGIMRLVVFLITAAISIGLLIHLFPGFTPWKIIDKEQLSANAYPFSLSLGFDKPIVGILVLALGLPLITTINDLERILKTALPLIILGIALMITLSLFSGLIKWDPKLPKLFWFFAIENLILVSVIEEAFWRGFVQRECFRWLGGKGFLANTGCVVLTSIFFAALHYFWVPSIPFLGLIFVASIIYGSIYQYTRSIEASIATHWLFNITHILLFTYPALIKG